MCAAILFVKKTNLKKTRNESKFYELLPHVTMELGHNQKNQTQHKVTENEESPCGTR